MNAFLARFSTLIKFVLSGFDRLRFVGESRWLINPRGVDSYLYQQKIRYVDFPNHAFDLTQTLRRKTEQQARDEDVPLRALNHAAADKQAVALELAKTHNRTSGRVALISSVEQCQTYRIRKGEDGRHFVLKLPGKCLHYYHYFLHDELGLCYVRLQSWFPFAVRVGVNGRECLYRQLEKRGVRHERRDNLLVAVENPAAAQEILDQQRRADWCKQLSELVRPIQPLWSYLHETARAPYYWMSEQSEWASDYVFHSPQELAAWYPRWLRHGVQTLQCRDVLRYLGKKLPLRDDGASGGYGGCTGEVKIDLRRRAEGTRLKFWYDTNSLKIYDKEAQSFRIETTINQPRGFKVFRHKENDPPDAPRSWRQLRKGVADLDRRAEISHAANQRLAESLATVAETRTLGELLRPLGRPVFQDGRRVARALNPLAGPDGDPLRVLAQGDFLLRGLRNADVRVALFGDTKDAESRRRQSAAVTRQLGLLRRHGLIVKVAKSHRYQLSAAGRRITTALLAAQQSDISRLAASA
ncbi:MAG: hypothetical protein ACKVS9_06480 [Phycisphaerae bacterium]